MVGSRDYNRDDIDGRVNNATAVNSPGSTLKPFTYATALIQGWSPDWPIVDTPITYTESDGSKFSPRNPNGGYKGIVKMKDALGNSYNIPAFKTILWAGVPNVVTTAKRMGITTLDRDLGPALTLGGVDVKLLDMVYGYSAFANGGEMAGMPTTLALPEGNRKLDPIPVLAIRNQHGDMLVNNTDPKKERVLGEEYAWMISDILSTDANRSSTYGRGSNLNIPGHTVAAKTGTSEPYADTKRLIGDTWTFGYTPDFAVGVWVGNSDNTPMVNILSTTIAGSTWHDTFLELLKDVPDKKFVRPDDKLVEATVCVPSGRIPVPGKYCPTVKGIFAKEALAHAMDPKWWGGQELQNPLPLDSRDIPAEVVDWKRKLAQEYQGRYGGGGGGGSTPRAAPTPQNQPQPPQQQQPAPAPTAAVEPPQPTPAPDIFPGRNGNGRRNR
jgi:membrane peptidoglycan carboxypeptidase